MAEQLQKFIEDGQKVAIHCRQGVGRSALLAACVLVLQGDFVETAFAKISYARGVSVPDTPEQVKWVEKFSEKLRNL